MTSLESSIAFVGGFLSTLALIFGGGYFLCEGKGWERLVTNPLKLRDERKAHFKVEYFDDNSDTWQLSVVHGPVETFYNARKGEYERSSIYPIKFTSEQKALKAIEKRKRQVGRPWTEYRVTRLAPVRPGKAEEQHMRDTETKKEAQAYRERYIKYLEGEYEKAVREHEEAAND